MLTHSGPLHSLSTHEYSASENDDPSYRVVAVMDQDGKEVAKAWWKDLMYVGEDGLFRTFEDLSKAQQTKVNEDEKCYFDPGVFGEGWFERGWFEQEVEHLDAGNSGGGVLSAALVFKPATKSGDSER